MCVSVPMYQIFCHELEDMGNSLFTYFLVFFSFFLVFSFLYFCLLVVVDHLLFDLLSTSSSGKPFFLFISILNCGTLGQGVYLIRLAGTHEIQYAVGVID